MNRIAYIDGLRGVAVLAVVLFHAGVHNRALNEAANTPLAFLLRQGCHGVDLFFILSGFCLAYPWLTRVYAGGRTRFSVSSFAAKRIVRILPPYYAAITVFTVLGAALLLLHIPLPEPIAREALSVTGILKQALFLDADRQFLDASFWTLAIEFRWYFLFPVLLWVWVCYPRAFAAIAVVALIGGATRIQSTDLFFLPFFMLGIVAAELHARRIPLLRFAVPCAIAALAAAAASTASGGWYFIEKGPLWGIAMFCIVVAAGATPPLRRLLSAKLLVRIGTLSYGIYLIHEPVVALIERSASESVGPAAAFALAVAGAMVAGVAFSIIAEQPFVHSALREKLTGSIHPVVKGIFARLGMSDTFELRPAPAAEALAA